MISLNQYSPHSYFEWVEARSGGRWGIILGSLGGWKNILGGWGWGHCLIMLKFIILDIRCCFAYGKSKLYGNAENCQNILARIVLSSMMWEKQLSKHSLLFQVYRFFNSQLLLKEETSSICQLKTETSEGWKTHTMYHSVKGITAVCIMLKKRNAKQSFTWHWPYVKNLICSVVPKMYCRHQCLWHETSSRILKSAYRNVNVVTAVCEVWHLSYTWQPFSQPKKIYSFYVSFDLVLYLILIWTYSVVDILSNLNFIWIYLHAIQNITLSIL